MAAGDKMRAMQVKAYIIADKNIGIMDINADVRDGVATLSGEVETEDQKRIAEKLALDVEGINHVNNQIRVLPEEGEEGPMEDESTAHLGYGLAEDDSGETAYSLSGAYAPPGPGVPASEQFPGEYTDEQVENEVREKLHKQEDVDISNIEVSVDNQIVCLKGKLKTADDLNNLRDAVMNTRGVMGVDTEIMVEEGDVGTPQA